MDSVINNPKYDNFKKIGYKCDNTSMKFIIARQLSQNQLIGLGNLLHEIIPKFIYENSRLYHPRNWEETKARCMKGHSEINMPDMVFVDYVRAIVYVVELKSNINLDTKKVNEDEYKNFLNEKLVPKFFV